MKDKNNIMGKRFGKFIVIENIKNEYDDMGKASYRYATHDEMMDGEGYGGFIYYLQIRGKEVLLFTWDNKILDWIPIGELVENCEDTRVSKLPMELRVRAFMKIEQIFFDRFIKRDFKKEK